MGYLIFNEPLALKWWVGASFILAGTMLLSQSQKKLDEEKTNNKKKE